MSRIQENRFDSFEVCSSIAEPDSDLQSCDHELPILAHDSALNSVTFFNDMYQDSQLIKPDEERPCAFPSASLKILRRCRSRVEVLRGGNIQLESPSTLSAIDIIELAAGNFIQSNSTTRIQHFAKTGLSTENAEDIRLVQDLLFCAEKVSNQDYDSACQLLKECQILSLRPKNVIQRLVYYFIIALGDKIERENGRFTGKGMVDCGPLEAAITPTSALSAFHENVPFNQITQFTSIQLMADHASGSSKVHIIDLEIYSGLHHIILMQALAARSECPLMHFKITAVAIHPSNGLIEETGVRLSSVAQSFNLSFSFLVITLEDFLDLEKKLFDPDLEETVIVHAAYALKHMIAKPSQLERLMRAISNINPSVMIIHELEANVNSPVFVNRFVEALFFYGAYFDCVEDCLKNDVAVRTFVESELFSPPLRNSVAAEGDERKFRSVSINVWRDFFRRFGMAETELSTLALDNAIFLLKRFDCKDSCTFDLNGKSLVVCWKETPICSISAWKFRGRDQS